MEFYRELWSCAQQITTTFSIKNLHPEYLPVFKGPEIYFPR